MSQHALLSLVTFVLIRLAGAQSATSSSLEPLASKHFTWPDIPYQVTGDQGGERGPQAGYNLCNSTTENQQSMCQVSTPPVGSCVVECEHVYILRLLSLTISGTFVCGAPLKQTTQ